MIVIEVILIMLKQAFLSATSSVLVIMSEALLVTQNGRHTSTLLLLLWLHRRCRGSTPSPSNHMDAVFIWLVPSIIIVPTIHSLAATTPATASTAFGIHIKVQGRKSSQLHLPHLVAAIGFQISNGIILSL
jgi:hypothetical protein